MRFRSCLLKLWMSYLDFWNLVNLIMGELVLTRDQREYVTHADLLTH